jgi:hypothetical protein
VASCKSQSEVEGEPLKGAVSGLTNICLLPGLVSREFIGLLSLREQVDHHEGRFKIKYCFSEESWGFRKDDLQQVRNADEMNVAYRIKKKIDF